MPLPIVALPIGAAALAAAMGGTAAYKSKKADEKKEFDETANKSYRKHGSKASPTRRYLAEASEEIPQDIQNALKDRQQEKAFEVGDAERKASMGSAFKKGGKVSSASSRADGCAIRGKTRA
jgi:hypothetical protein